MIKNIKDLIRQRSDYTYYWLPFKEDEEYLVMRHQEVSYVFNYKGDLVFSTPYIFTKATGFDLEDGYLHHCGIIDFEYGREIIYLNYGSYGDALTKYGFIDDQGNLITKIAYQDFGEEWILGKYISAQKEGKYGYIDRDGKELTPFIFDFCNIDTEWMDHPHYDILEILISEITWVNNSSNYQTKKGVFGWNGNIIIPAIYKTIEIVDEYDYGIDFNITNLKEVKKNMSQDKIYLSDFSGNNFIWTYKKGIIPV